MAQSDDKIQLTNGLFVFVDKEDYTKLSQHTWHYTKHKKATSGYAKGYVMGKSVFMHRFIMNAQTGEEVDHKDANGLNNQKQNLRIATRSQNAGNTPKRRANTSGYKGVFWDKTKKKWLAQLHTKKRSIHLGRYLNKEDAARAYDKAALAHFGEFAALNFPKE